MVFESLVVDLINKYLGDYVENLDRSQLKLGIWGGDAVLQNLDLKESALDDLDLPVKIKAGHIGKLTLKIPWKNLYTEPVVATIDGLYALAVPNVAVKYNEEKEEKAKQESKQKKLQQIEDAKKLEAEKDKPKEVKKDSFAEKMAAQIIKNLQVQVMNVHVRYEDKYSNPKRPFSIGVSLKELLFQTTDENWKPCVIKEAVTQIFKLIKLDSLAVYWNPNSEQFDGKDKATVLSKLTSGVADSEKDPGFQYLIKPISSVAHLRLNTKPELNKYTIPKIFMTIVFDDISVGLSKLQFDDVLEMLESLERMNLLNKYRKYRPDVPHKNHAKQWWHYAMNSVLEEDIRNRRKMWSWSYINQHRRTMKQYREAYVKKLDGKKVSKELQKTLDDCEKVLNVFSVTLMRQQAEVEAAKLGAKKAQEKGSGWFGGWLGGKKKSGEKKEEDIKDKFQEQFTSDEKSKLYDAIGYEENEADPTLPKEFIALRLVTKLTKMSITLRDDSSKDSHVIRLQLKDVFSSVGQRPAANAIQVEAKMDKFTVQGTPQNGQSPYMALSQTKEADQVYSLLNAWFETNPLDATCDTRVRLNSRPLQIIYDAVTINNLVKFFKPPEDVYLQQLSQAAVAKFEQIKEQSATGLQHAIEQRKYTEISVDLQPSYVIIPDKGYYTKDGRALILDLGNLKVGTEKSKSKYTKGQQMETVEELMKRAYDKFNIKLDRIQVLFSSSGEEWRVCRKQPKSPMHILEPISINIVLQKCMFDKDPRMAKMKVSGELPLLKLNMSDRRLHDLIGLTESIPLPESAPPPKEDFFLAKTEKELKMEDTAIVAATQALIPGQVESKQVDRSPSQEFINYTDMELNFEIKQVDINISQVDNGKDIPVLRLVVMSLGTKVTMCTYDMNVAAYLGGVYVQHRKFVAPPGYILKGTPPEVDGPVVNIVNTPGEDGLKNLLEVQYLKANKDGPEFATTYKNIEQKIDVTFTSLEVLLHQEALLHVLELVEKLKPAPKPTTEVVAKTTEEGKDKEKTDEKEDKKKAIKKKKDTGVIDIQVNARLNEFQVALCTEQKYITDVRIKGIHAGVTMETGMMTVTATLTAISILDPCHGTLYPRIMDIEEGEKVLNTKLVIYDDATKGDNYAVLTNVDTSVEVDIGCIRLVFLNKFVGDILGFLNKFLDGMQEQLNKAKEMAAEYSKDVAQKLQERAPRVSLNVKMKAPVIIVPQNSKSTNALVADFGSLSVQNSFSKAGESENKIPFVLDKMVVELTSLKMSRAVIGKKLAIQDESLILEPVTITVSITRNLSAAIFTEVPAIDITGVMKSVSAKLSQKDFSQIMTTLNENLTEGQVPLPQSTEVALGELTDKEVMESHVIPPPLSRQPSEELTCKLKFSFEIESLSATLYVGHEDLMAQRADKAALGKVELQVIAVSGKQMSDESMEVKVILKDMVLDDSRQHKVNGITSPEIITRMIQRSKSRLSEEGSSNMIDVSFKQDCSKDSNVDVRVNSLYICVCLDYLMSLGDFFTKGMPQKDKGEVMKQETKPSKTQKKVKEELPHPPSNCMDIVVKIEKPEIILIEDQLNPNCNCLVLDMEVIFKMKIHPESQDMSANVRDLQIFSCVFSKRGAIAAQILNPCEISFYSKTPYGKGAHMDIATSDLILNISPATIKTMSGISAALAAKPGSEDETSKYTVPVDLWEVKKLSETDFWFLKTGEEVELEPEEILDELIEEEVRAEQTTSEMLIAKIPTMVIKIEGGVGKRTVPLLIVEASFSGEVKDWSSKLSVESTLKLEVAYYNEKLSVWEPLLEPVVEDGKMKRWELGLEVMMNDDLPPPPDEDGDSVDIVLPPPKMTVTVFSHDEMQLIMSKTCLEVLQNLGKSFGDAYRLVEPSEKAGEIISPFCVQNLTGIEIIMKLDNSFEMPQDADNFKVKMTPDRQLELWNKKKGLSRKASVIKAAQEGDEKKFIFQIEQYNATREVTVKRAEKRLYQINHKTYPGDIWSVIVNTETPIGHKILSIQSMVQIKNHFEIPVEVFYKDDVNVKSCGVVAAESNFSVPLQAVYTPGGEFLFKPVYENYQVSKETVSWRGAENLGTVQLACQGESGHSAFYISVRAEIENVYFDVGDTMSAKSFIFHLSPTVILHNLLPYPIRFQLEGTEDHTTLQKGKNTALLNACVGKSNVEIVIPIYEGKEWVGHRSITNDLPELSMLTFEAYEGAQQVTQNLGLHCKKNDGCMDISVYSPYWMVNKTGQDLFYKASDGEDFTTHGHDNLDIVMFSFKQKTLFSTKKKASLKIATSDWSDKFSLDTVGSSGDVQCKSSKKQTFSVGVKITLSSSGLTKICTFTPFYMLLNTSEYTLMCQETGQEGDDWIQVASKECKPFWPVQSGKDLTMKAKFSGSAVETSQFLFSKPHTTLMKLLDQFEKCRHGGLNVDCQVTESATVVTLSEYMDGMATVLLVNHTEKAMIHFHQSGLKTEHVLNAQQYMLYTWETATGKREVIWSCGEKKDTKNDLQQDGIGEFFAHSDSKIYWVSFLNGMQRVLLFTEDLALATIAQEAGELERIEQEINICIQGLGLSLVNDYKQKEVAYIGITSSGIIWEEKRKRYRALNVKTGETLEKGYQKYANELEAGHTPASKVHLENKMEVDWNEMMMYKPNKRQIRRSFQEGIWLQYKTSPHQIQLHAKIQRLQLDNQMSDATFQTVLAPTPLAKSIAAESIPKPFTELSMMQRKHEHIEMSQFKYFKVLTQEMTLKVDQGFLNELIELFSSSGSVSRDQETTLMEEDYKRVHVTLIEDAGLSLAQEQKNFYDYLHFSPIKVHLSFSLQGGGGDGKQTAIQSDVINIFLQSVGVVLTDVQDVVFKLGYFQREHKFYNQSQMTGEMTRHYASQAIKQMYVLVLGLDVLGNPFGLIRGMAEGIEDLFYEPYQGAIQGPEEFAEGLALGVRSLFGHAVGGAAGAVSRITGALGKGIATLTLDDDYQKKRKEAMNKRPANVREGFARGGKGLVMGVFDGVTGIVRKPIEGAQTEGVGGFFKGLGKGLVGVVTRPTSGVIDFASSSFEGIKRIADMSVEVRRLRNPRIFSADKIIRPYNRREADGYMILQETEKGKFASTDHYVAHAVISKDGRHVLIITDKRVIYANRGEIFGHWDAEWSYTWGEIKETPKRNPKGIEIVLKEKEKRKFPFGSSSAKKDVHIFNTQTADYVHGKIVEAMNRHK
ncbi:intermembrane lipid transfer protein VPS13A-like isoform X11 [Mytilus californianus]|uniref:intermembrane lipid transfer protein VPS13A-like isoform X11 n=1 Tax=Mytilus californianus TaxID=6549 RepID=UPI0022453566|nr:intermembrane lipid transfer protein VPS13A-like isoform X11 [Mytilus californianus]